MLDNRCLNASFFIAILKFKGLAQFLIGSNYTRPLLQAFKF